MAIQARFNVQEVSKYAYMAGWAPPAPGGKVTLRAVTGQGNEPWASATPQGELTMTVKGEAVAWFEARLGQTVAITLDDVPEPPSA